jgi:Tfp pilus assembly protein PilV
MSRFSRRTRSSDAFARVRLARKRAHCAAQASLFEVLVAVAILTTAVWGMVGFLANGRVLVERSGQGIIAAHVAEQQIDQTRALAYTAITGSNGKETVGGLVYTWVMTVATARADPADAGSTFKQVAVTVSWPSAPNAVTMLSTAISPQ